VLVFEVDLGLAGSDEVAQFVGVPAASGLVRGSPIATEDLRRALERTDPLLATGCCALALGDYPRG
jgi:hypothetical protein